MTGESNTFVFAGGSCWSEQTTHFPCFEDFSVENNSLELQMIGGYGFGIDRRGFRLYGGV